MNVCCFVNLAAIGLDLTCKSVQNRKLGCVTLTPRLVLTLETYWIRGFVQCSDLYTLSIIYTQIYIYTHYIHAQTNIHCLCYNADTALHAPRTTRRAPRATRRVLNAALDAPCYTRLALHAVLHASVSMDSEKKILKFSQSHGFVSWGAYA